MTERKKKEIVSKLTNLRVEHRDLDGVIESLCKQQACDQLMLQRLKKRKLVLKDQINQIEATMLPDIIA